VFLTNNFSLAHRKQLEKRHRGSDIKLFASLCKGRFCSPRLQKTNGLQAGKELCRNSQKMRRFCILTTEIREQFCVKKRIELSQTTLGLDGERSWIILDDFNDFIWPGYDLRLVPGKSGRYDYGLLPPVLFDKIIAKILDLQRQGKVFSTPRDEK
jgi:hypothetical protein